MYRHIKSRSWARCPILVGLICFLSIAVASASGPQGSKQTYIIPLAVRSIDTGFTQGVQATHIQLEKPSGAVRRLTHDSQNRRIAILLDASGSMAGWHISRPWDLAIPAAQEFLRNVQAGDLVSLHLFAEKTETISEFTGDFSVIDERLKALPRLASKASKARVGYGTALADALETIQNSMQIEPRFGDAILLITDATGDTRSSLKVKDVLRRLAANGCRLFVIATPAGLSASRADFFPFEESRYDEVTTLANETGGLALTPWGSHNIPQNELTARLDPREISRVAELTYMNIRHTYKAEIEFTRAISSNEKLKIGLSDQMRRSAGNLMLAYPRYLVAR